MNKILYAFSLILLMVACKPAEFGEIGFSGTIENIKGDTLRLLKNEQVEKFAIAQDGTFSGVFMGKAGYYELSYNRETTVLYLEPGNKISMTLNTNEFDESIAHTGEGSNPNNYLAKKFLLIEDLQKKQDVKSLFSMNEADFTAVVESQKAQAIGLMNESKLPKAFTALESENLKYQYLGMANNYESYHKYFTENEGFKASDAFNKQFENLDFGNEANFNDVPDYKAFVMNHFTNGELPETIAKLKTVESTVIKNAIIDQLSRYLSPGTENLESLVGDMKSLTTDEKMSTGLTATYEKMKVLAKGNISPGFDYQNVKGGTVNLADLKGKNVYIDVWATWCGPCKAEIPHLKELEKEYHGKDIEFVSLSVDERKDEEKWKAMIADKELTGIQLLSDDGWNTDFVRNYLIMGIPRFILLDKEGKIVSSDAPRPSSGSKLKGMIDGLL